MNTDASIQGSLNGLMSINMLTCFTVLSKHQLREKLHKSEVN